MPSSCSVVAAGPDADWRDCSIVFSDVPASEPTKPACANALRVPTVSSRDSPVCDATSPACLRDMPSCPTSVADLFAPAASTSAMCATSPPWSWNMFIACAAMVAASARSMLPAAASDRVPVSAPPRMSEVEIPAFASSSSAVAASVAENAVSLPACMAAARRLSRLLPAAGVGYRSDRRHFLVEVHGGLGHDPKAPTRASASNRGRGRELVELVLVIFPKGGEFGVEILGGPNRLAADLRHVLGGVSRQSYRDRPLPGTHHRPARVLGQRNRRGQPLKERQHEGDGFAAALQRRTVRQAAYQRRHLPAGDQRRAVGARQVRSRRETDRRPRLRDPVELPRQRLRQHADVPAGRIVQVAPTERARVLLERYRGRGGRAGLDTRRTRHNGRRVDLQRAERWPAPDPSIPDRRAARPAGRR